MKRLIIFIVILSNYSNCWCQQFPAVTIKDIAGKEIAFPNLVGENGDTAIIISFWATWCGPCVMELTNINEQLSERHITTPFKFLAISVDDERTVSKVKSFVKAKGWVFDIYLDTNNDLKRALNINDMPHVLIIQNSKIIYQHTGYVAGAEEELFEKL